jgi:IS5 family transposase
MEAHIRGDAKMGQAAVLKTSASDEDDLNKAEHLLHGEENYIFADSGDRRAESGVETGDVEAEFNMQK